MKEWLLESVDTDTNGDRVVSDGGPLTVIIWATDFGSGTVTLEATPDGGTTWIPLTIGGVVAAFTADAVRWIEGLNQGIGIRATLTGSTGADNVNVRLF